MPKININQLPQNDILTQFCGLLNHPLPSSRHFFLPVLQTSFSETLNHNDGSGEPLLFSYLPFLLPSSFSNTQGCQVAKTGSLPSVQHRLYHFSS